MAGGYWHDPTGIAGVIRILRKMQRQIDELRGSAGIKSAILRGDKFQFQNASGQGTVLIGTGSVLSGGDSVEAEGIQVDNPATNTWILAAYRRADGSTNAQIGESGSAVDDFYLCTVDALLDISNDAFFEIGNNAWWDVVGTFDVDAQVVDLRSTGGAMNLNATGDINVDPDGDLKFYITTTTNPANLNQTTNAVRLVSSGRKYKADIQDADVDPVDVLALRPRTWVDRGELERDPSYSKRTPGFIAEELDERETLRQFVSYNDAGEPDSIYYDRLSVALVKLAQDQQARLDSLEERVAALEAGA